MIRLLRLNLLDRRRSWAHTVLFNSSIPSFLFSLLQWFVFWSRGGAEKDSQFSRDGMDNAVRAGLLKPTNTWGRMFKCITAAAHNVTRQKDKTLNAESSQTKMSRKYYVLLSKNIFPPISQQQTWLKTEHFLSIEMERLGKLWTLNFSASDSGWCRMSFIWRVFTHQELQTARGVCRLGWTPV